MKNFHLDAYITPIVDEILQKFEVITDSSVCGCLSCECLLKNKQSRDCLAIRKNDCFYYSGPSMIQLQKQIRGYVNAIETYPGELDDWEWEEKRKINYSVRDQILQKICKNK